MPLLHVNLQAPRVLTRATSAPVREKSRAQLWSAVWVGNLRCSASAMRMSRRRCRCPLTRSDGSRRTRRPLRALSLFRTSKRESSPWTSRFHATCQNGRAIRCRLSGSACRTRRASSSSPRCLSTGALCSSCHALPRRANAWQLPARSTSTRTGESTLRWPASRPWRSAAPMRAPT